MMTTHSSDSSDPDSFSNHRETVACLLLHGFTGTPGEMAPLANFLRQRGVSVSAPLLPGHGTTSSNLRGVRWEDWLKTAVRAFDELRGCCSEVHVMGLSMGGALALRLCPERTPTSLVTMAAPVAIHNWRAFLIPPLRWFFPRRKKRDGPDIRDPKAKAEIESYLEYPLEAAAQVMRLASAARSALPRIQVPTLIAHSRQDHSVPYRNALLIHKCLGSARKELLTLEESYHVITVDVEKKLLMERIWRFLNSASPALAPPGTAGKFKMQAE